MDTLRIERVPDGVEVPLSDEPLPDVWEQAHAVSVDTYPWRAEPADLRATARLLYDEASLYAHFRVADQCIRAEARELNGDVWRDSCVELFFSPERVTRRHYVNVEVNCVGQFLVKFGDSRADRRAITPEQAADIRVATSVQGSAKDPSPTDSGWWLAVELPFDALNEFVGCDVAPVPGSVWYGNLYCCRGGDAPAHVVWRPTGTPTPDFHRPEAFGRFSVR